MSVQKKKASETERGSLTERPYYDQEEETRESEESCEESSEASSTEMLSDEVCSSRDDVTEWVPVVYMYRKCRLTLRLEQFQRMTFMESDGCYSRCI